MKLSLCLILVLTTLGCSQGRSENGNIDPGGLTELEVVFDSRIGEVVLYRFEENDWIPVDSSDNGKLTLSMNDHVPQMMRLVADDTIEHLMFTDTGNVVIEIKNRSLDAISVQGSHYHDEYVHFEELIAPFDEKLDEVASGYDEADEIGKNIIIQLYDSLNLERDLFIEQYVIEHGTSFLSPYLVVKHFIYQTDSEMLQDFVNSFDKSISNSVYISWINERIETLNKTAIGNEIPTFELPDKNGKLVSITDFKGSYVLIDFWASWCGPCRRENPNVVKAYDLYKDAGFTVLGVSLDTDKDSWLKAIEKDGLNWTQISDLNGWDNSVAQDFGVMSIPFSILIDPDGIIKAKNLRGEELQNFLSEEFINQ